MKIISSQKRYCQEVILCENDLKLQLNDVRTQNMHNFGHKIGPEGSRFERKSPQFWPKAKRSFSPKRHCFGPKLAAHTRVRIKRLGIHPFGVVREPVSRRLTVRLRKEISCLSLCRIRMGLRAPSDKKKKKIG